MISPPDALASSEPPSPAARSAPASALDHLVPLPGGTFGVWPWACLRGAGFASDAVLSLAAPATAALLDASPKEKGDDPALRACFDDELLRIRGYLRGVAQDERFREAVLWQNRGAFKTGVEGLASRPLEPTANKKVRQRERLVTLYLQRYCTKNDTIGFFGPVGWARIGTGTEALTLDPGEALIEERRVHFETWCIDALAEALCAEPALRRWAPPRLLPYLRLDGGVLHAPGMPPSPLPPAHAALLCACDGVTPAMTIAARLSAGPSRAFASEEEALAALEAARAMGAVTWGWEVALGTWPERELARAFERIGDPALRERAEGALSRLVEARAEVSRAAGDARALDVALGRLDETFHGMTGASPTRAAGRAYAGRTLVYEDCRRSAQVTLGAPLLDRLGPPLSLVLSSARWFAAEIVRGYREALVRLFESVRRPGEDAVELSTLQRAFLDSGPELVAKGGRGPLIVQQARRELDRRWAEILDLPAEATRVERTVEALRPRVREAFGEPVPGAWAARYLAPDVMISGADVDAIRRGEVTFVLGEIHLSNTLSSLFVDAHPAPEQLLAMVDRERAGKVVVPVFTKDSWPQRTRPCLFPSDAYHYAFSSEPSPAPAERTVRMADFVVVRAGDGLEVRHRAGSPRFELMEFMGVLTTSIAASAFDLAPAMDHSPRITVGDVVIARESWRVAPDRIPFVDIDDPLARWVEARRFQRRLGLPRFAFIRTPAERKPCYVDFDSPVLVELMAKLVRQSVEAGAAGPIRLSEMLPSFDELWLVDREGKAYTSELRCVVYDPTGLAGDGASSPPGLG
ncbi:lantibiotic dehydratase [Sorangium sp. So ce1153]|uniref:lantibiotic dehydratase n=1 Tax=Sorangium sp. So ce1153 TaxID=3133333 RepID=UPI003F62A2B2